MLPLTGVHVAKFTKDSVFHHPEQARYALAYSSDRRAMASLGNMEFDAQVAFMGGAARWACAGDGTKPENFPDAPASKRQTLSIVFVPRKDEEKAIAAIKKTMWLWGRGKASPDPIGHFQSLKKSVWTGVGLNFTPDGMIAAFVDTTGQLQIVESGARRERFFSPSGVVIKDVHGLESGHDWTGSAAYWEGDYAEGGSDLWNCAKPEAWRSVFNANDAGDRVGSFFNFLRAQMEAKALREIVSGAVKKDSRNASEAAHDGAAPLLARRTASRV